MRVVLACGQNNDVMPRCKDADGHGSGELCSCLLYTSPSPRDTERSRMPSSA